MEVAVDSLWRREQVKHLPQGEFKVHLFEMEQPSEVLVALCSRRVTCSIARTEGAVALRRSGRQHGAEDHVGRACEIREVRTRMED